MTRVEDLKQRFAAGEDITAEQLAEAADLDKADAELAKMTEEREAVRAKAERTARAIEAARSAEPIFNQIDEVDADRAAQNEAIKEAVAGLLDGRNRHNRLLTQARTIIERAKGIEPTANVGMDSRPDGYTTIAGRPYTPVSDWEFDLRNLFNEAIVEAKQRIKEN